MLAMLGLGKIQMVVMIGLGIALAGASYLAYYQIKQNGILQGNVTIATDALKEERETLAAVTQLYDQQITKFKILSGEQRKLEEEKNRAVSELNSFRGRFSTPATRKHATLVSRRATRATRSLMCEFYAATGGQGSCGDQEDPPGAAGPD